MMTLAYVIAVVLVLVVVVWVIYGLTRFITWIVTNRNDRYYHHRAEPEEDE
jgi:hypothetical protein